MLKRLSLLALLSVLAGCATYETRHVYYEDGHYADRAHVYRDGSYYVPSHGRHGDYYVGQSSYRHAGHYYYPHYLEWPAYYSLFWGFNRWYHDPFFHPGYYYGVTYYPRNYLSFSAWYGLNRWDVGYRYFPYSPYRYAWYDHYYDWSWWHRHYPTHRHHQNPRYGSARNEAERLAWQSRNDSRAGWQQALDPHAQGSRDSRRADYSSRPRERQDPRLGAFDSGRSARLDEVRQAAREGRRLTGSDARSLRAVPQSTQDRDGREQRWLRDGDRRVTPVDARAARAQEAPGRTVRPAGIPGSETRAAVAGSDDARHRPPSVERASGEPRRMAAPATRIQPLASPSTRESRARAPELRQVQPPRAYAGPEGYARPAPAPAVRATSRPSDYGRDAAAVSRSAPARSAAPAVSIQRAAPQVQAPQTQGRVMAAPVSSAPVQRGPARQQGRQESTRAESTRSQRGPRED